MWPKYQNERSEYVEYLKIQREHYAHVSFLFVRHFVFALAMTTGATCLILSVASLVF